MIHSDEMYLDQQEADFLRDEETNYADMQRLRDDQQQEYETIPVIDITSMQPSTATAEQIANSIIEAVKDGRISPLELAVKRKCIETALELALKDTDVKNMCIDEVEKHGKQGATCLGAKITLTAKRTYKYEFDPKWREIKASMSAQEEQLKAQEEKIKAACKNNGSIIDQETGELIASVVPAPETTSIAVSFKK